VFYNTLIPQKKLEVTNISRISVRDLAAIPGPERLPAACEDSRSGPQLAGGPEREFFALLEVIATFASPPPSEEDSERLSAARRLLRWGLQDQAGKLLPGERVAKCLRWRVPVKNRVEVWRSQKHKKAHYKNLMVCGSVWRCPVCAAKITERRRVELEKVIRDERFIKVMVTITLQHKSWESLERLYDGLAKAYRGLKSGAPWERIEKKFGVALSIKGTEVTWGEKSGWHPHFHVVFFLDQKGQKMSWEAKQEFNQVITDRFIKKAENSGFYVSPEYGVKVSFDQDHASAYAAKWGMESELAKGPVKMAKGENLSPFQLLAESVSPGERGKKFAALFQEYAAAMKEKKQLVWSNGARELFELGQEVSDQELAEAVQDDSALFAGFRDDDWKKVLKAAARGKLLEAASSGDHDLFTVYLASIGVVFGQDQFLEEVSLDVGRKKNTSQCQGCKDGGPAG
jgi:hypothetical protein